MRNGLHTLLMLISAWLLAVLGSMGGMFLASLQVSNQWVPTSSILAFAVSWGLWAGAIPSFGMVALVAEFGERTERWWPYAAGCAAIALASGFGLYVFAVSTAAI